MVAALISLHLKELFIWIALANFVGYASFIDLALDIFCKDWWLKWDLSDNYSIKRNYIKCNSPNFTTTNRLIYLVFMSNDSSAGHLYVRKAQLVCWVKNDYPENIKMYETQFLKFKSTTIKIFPKYRMGRSCKQIST